MDSKQIHAAFDMLEKLEKMAPVREDNVKHVATVFLREVECEELRHCDFAVSVQSSIELEAGRYALDDELGMIIATQGRRYFLPYDAVSHVEIVEVFR